MYTAFTQFTVTTPHTIMSILSFFHTHTLLCADWIARSLRASFHRLHTRLHSPPPATQPGPISRHSSTQPQFAVDEGPLASVE